MPTTKAMKLIAQSAWGLVTVRKDLKTGHRLRAHDHLQQILDVLEDVQHSLTVRTP
jgi:hypothetical protein